MFEIRVPHSPAETRIPRTPQQPDVRHVYRLLPRDPRPPRTNDRR
jgi:hypothetical protein